MSAKHVAAAAPPAVRRGPPELAVLAEATATVDTLADVRPRRRSFYADPLAWLVTDAVARAMADAGGKARPDPEGTGVLTVSSFATNNTLTDVVRALPHGRLSPMRFVAASPGTVAGVACLVLNLRGPALVLTMAPDVGRPFAEVMSRAWLTTGCSYVVVAEHEADGTGGHQVHAAVMALA